MKTLEQITLKSGAHSSPEDGMCAMEAIAYIQREKFSDRPACVCPVIAAFMRRWNDDLPTDEVRNALLKPLLPLCVGTRATPEIERQRSYLAIDWFIRVCTPAWLDLVPALKPHADAIRQLAPIADLGTMRAGEAVLKDAQKAAAAAWAAAGAAAWDVARDAAGDAAWAAAWAAAWDVLKPTIATLQESATDLLKRMAAIGGAQ